MSRPDVMAIEMPTAKTLLLIDDDESIRFLLHYLLSRHGFDVIQASDGQQAFDLIEGCLPPQLVLLDCMLPFMDGFALLKHLRSKPGWATVPVLMLTAQTEEADIQRAMDLGATGYVLKPFEPLELLERLDGYLPSSACKRP